jgi:hypothetical protein
LVEYVSHSGNYPTYRDWAPAKPALIDFIDDDTQTNLAFEYAKALEYHVKNLLLDEMANIVGSTKQLKNTYDARACVPDAEWVEEKERKKCKCANTHCNPFDTKEFEPVLYPIYFSENGELNTAVCQVCSKNISETGNISDTTPVYVCKTLMRMKRKGGESHCSGQDNNSPKVGVWCNACAVKHIPAGRARRRAKY